MKFQLLVAGAAVIALSAGVASAATSSKFAAPQQPVAYSKLDSYLKASPRARAQGDWTNDQTASAQTGTPANASAQSGMTAQPPAQSDMSAPAGQAAPATGAMPDAGPAAEPPATDSSAPPPAQSGGPDSSQPPASMPQGSGSPN